MTDLQSIPIDSAARREQLLLAGLTRARSGATPEEIVGYATEFETWINAGQSDSDRVLRHRAILLAYSRFAPAGVEASLHDSAKTIYDFLRSGAPEPAAPPTVETKQPPPTRLGKGHRKPPKEAG